MTLPRLRAFSLQYCGLFSTSVGDVDGDAAAGSEHKEPFTTEMSPNPGPDCLGLISNSDKTGSGQEHDLSYRIMVDAGSTPARVARDEARQLLQAHPDVGDDTIEVVGHVSVPSMSEFEVSAGEVKQIDTPYP